MKEYVKAYDMFLPGRFMKYMIYLIMPVAIICLNGLISVFFPISQAFGLSLSSLYVFWGEIMLDGWNFRGISKKNNYNLEYIKTSAKWKRLLKKGLIFDSIRRLLSITFVLGASFAVFRVMGGAKGESAGVVFLVTDIMYSCFFTTLVLGIIRRTENVYVTLAAIYLSFIPFFAGIGVVGSSMCNIQGIVILAALFAGTAAFIISNIVKRIGGSFYDE